MKVLVTGGAGFIGSHTCDRLLALGHDVVVLDALTPPVHRGGRPADLPPDADFYEGDTRNRDLVTNLLRRVDAVYHFAAYQDYLPDFSRFSDVNVVSTALLYEIIVAEHLDLARVVVASSQSAMGEGLYRCPVDGEQLPGMRPENALGTGQWDIPCPQCGGPLEMQATPERISNPQNAYGMSKLGEEMVASLQRLLGRVPHLLPELPAGHSADPLRGWCGNPRLRQYRRRGGRQRARARRQPRGGPGLQRRRRQGGHDQGIR
ncbi:MAG: NAD-dependent epimerase/dehydratase family protein [Streptosporangiaceae bacterium]